MKDRMVLKMKNVNIMGVQQFLGEEGHKKSTYGELPKKGGLAKNREKGAFDEGGLIPRCTL